MQDIGTIKFLELTPSRVEQAAEIAEEIGVGGMDDVVIQVAKEFSVPLLSLDIEMVSKAKPLVEIELVENLAK